MAILNRFMHRSKQTIACFGAFSTSLPLPVSPTPKQVKTTSHFFDPFAVMPITTNNVIPEDVDVIDHIKQEMATSSRPESRPKSPLVHIPYSPHPVRMNELGVEGQVDASALKYPRSVIFIIGNEFCERFSFYGMKAILPIYLTAYLLYSENRSTTIIHTFNFMAYFFTIFGGILSDSWLGKFKTILYLSIVYCIGSCVLAGTSFPALTGNPPTSWGMWIGLVLLSVGTGGIKPCVSSFGGDQFHPSQTRRIETFFSAFYWAINAGSVLSMFITPILRQDVHCFGQESCYPLAFGLPAFLMLIATVIFVSGFMFYKTTPAEGNVVLKVLKASNLALKNKYRAWRSRGVVEGGRSVTPRAHWLDYADTEYSPQFLKDVQDLMGVLVIFIPICAFWALYDQQGSRWIYQAIMMGGSVNMFGRRFSIKPEQMGVANAILILAFIPIFNHAIYPGLNKLGIATRPLGRMLVGLILAIISFIMAGTLQFIINSRSVFAPSPVDPALRVCVGNCVHVLWQIPQYLVLTMAEVLISITGLEFAYSQAPPSLKSVCSASWLLTVAFGNLMVMILNELDIVGFILKRHASGAGNLTSPEHAMIWNFFYWAGILGLSTGLFAWLTISFKYKEQEETMAISNDHPSPKTKRRRMICIMLLQTNRMTCKEGLKILRK